MRDMLGREDAIPVHEAQRLLFEHISVREPSTTVRILIEKAYQRVLSENIYSSEDLPAFSRSTVDGYAVISADTFGATEGLCFPGC
jgi:molybdopterin biosynthesis enzyme